MVHKGPPDRTAGGAKLDQMKGCVPNPVRRRQSQAGQRHQQDDGSKAAAVAAAASDLKKMLKKARSIKRISENLDAHLGQKQVEQLRAPSPRKHKRRPNPGLLATPSPAIKAPGRPGLSPPNYMKATTSSDARTGRHQHLPQEQPQHQVSKVQPIFATPAADKRRSFTTPKTPSAKTLPSTSAPASTTKTPKTLLLTRKPSLKLVIPAVKKCPATPLFENISVSKSTCSSTLKDSKFPNELELYPGGTQVDGTSVIKVCPYTYCSLNGHWHADVPPLKRFLSAKRKMLRAQKSMRARRSPSPRKRVIARRGAAEQVEIDQEEHGPEISPRSIVLDEQNDDYFLEIYVNANEGVGDHDSAFGEGQRDPEFAHFNTDGEAEAPGVVLHEHMDPNMIRGDDGSYAEMNLDDDNVDRLSEISISEMELTATFLQHVECLDQDATPDAAAPDVEENASLMRGCGKQKSDDGSAMFNLTDFLQQQPIQDQRSLTASEAVEVDCQEEMPEYTVDGAGDDEEHEEGAGGENASVLDVNSTCSEDNHAAVAEAYGIGLEREPSEDVPYQNEEKPSAVESPQGNDQEGPDSSRSMDEIYFSLVFLTSGKRAQSLQQNPTREEGEELGRNVSEYVEINESEEALHLQEVEVLEEVADRDVSESVEIVASDVPVCMENLGSTGDKGEALINESDELAGDIFTAETEAENQVIAETIQEAQEIVGETVEQSHGIDDDGIFLTEIQAENQGITETNQESNEAAETVEESHETDDDILLTDIQKEDVRGTETEPEAKEIAEEEAITDTTLPSDCCIQDDLTQQEQDDQTSVSESNDRLSGGIKQGCGEERKQTDEAQTSSELTEPMTTEDGSCEAAVDGNVIAGVEQGDLYSGVPAKDEIIHATENLISETTLVCPQEEPATRRVLATPKQLLPEMDSESITVMITKRIHEEDMDELSDVNFRDPNFLPLESDPEGEKVDLRHQMMDERKNAEEWMIDYALQRAVSKLAPARKKKVALLVEAFETVAPPPIYKAPLRHNNLDFSHTRPMQACI